MESELELERELNEALNEDVLSTPVTEDYRAHVVQKLCDEMYGMCLPEKARIHAVKVEHRVYEQQLGATGSVCIGEYDQAMSGKIQKLKRKTKRSVINSYRRCELGDEESVYLCEGANMYYYILNGGVEKGVVSIDLHLPVGTFEGHCVLLQVEETSDRRGRVYFGVGVGRQDEDGLQRIRLYRSLAATSSDLVDVPRRCCKDVVGRMRLGVMRELEALIRPCESVYAIVSRPKLMRL